MRKIFWVAAGLLASLASGAAMAQHHGGGHFSGNGGYRSHGSYGGHGVAISGHGYRHAQPYYGNGYYADYPRYQPRYRVREHYGRPRQHRRHH